MAAQKETVGLDGRQPAIVPDRNVAPTEPPPPHGVASKRGA
jgi:hypothetical protein